VSVGADNEKIERGTAPSTVSTVGDSAVHVLVGVVVGQGDLCKRLAGSGAECRTRWAWFAGGR